ncbi:MAG: hypothetical protein IH577_01850 [Deltaproteobacteria bacterium]|nr:hypothetical protein [Deltaproteobacteria bacterium]
MAAATPMELKRHCVELSEQETEELVAAVADLIVNFLKGNRESVQSTSAGVAADRPEIKS